VVKAVAFLCCLVGIIAEPAAAAAITTETLRELKSVVIQLAACGQVDDADRLIELLRKRRVDPKTLKSMVSGRDRALKSRPRTPSPMLARRIRELSKTLSVDSELALALDADNEAAHKKLGHLRFGQIWVEPWIARALKRREAIRDHTSRARQLEVQLRVEKSPLVAAGLSVEWRGLVRLHSATHGKAALSRILSETLRALAFSNWLRGRPLELPEFHTGVDVVITADLAEYRAFVKKAVPNRVRPSQVEETVNRRGFWLRDGVYVCRLPERQIEAMLFNVLHRRARIRGLDGLQPPLGAGHGNFVCFSYLREPYIVPGGFRVRGGGDAERGTVASVRASAEREQKAQRAKVGLYPMRSYMLHLAERGEDPAFVDCIRVQQIDLGGDRLIKSTFVVQFLHEIGEFNRIAEITRKEAGSRRDRIKVFEFAWDGTLAELERRWRTWLLTDKRSRGALQRLRTSPNLTGVADEVAAKLDKIRRASLTQIPGAYEPLLVEPRLCEGADLHARYLSLNKTLATGGGPLWQRAHREVPGQPGFTPIGAWVAARSIICGPRTEDVNAAIESWMGTFYHRVPILRPGLIGFGYGSDGGTFVCDLESLCDYGRDRGMSIWPAPGATNVPRRFEPESPSPVLGVDQATMGYPITVVYSLPRANPIRVDLFDGARAVECFRITPAAPLNPALVPHATYGLIPKSALRAQRTYTVRLSDPSADSAREWSFRTR